MFVFLWSADFFFSKFTISKKSFRNTISMSEYQTVWTQIRLVRPDQDPNCLQRLSEDVNGRQRVKGVSDCHLSEVKTFQRLTVKS